MRVHRDKLADSPAFARALEALKPVNARFGFSARIRREADALALAGRKPAELARRMNGYFYNKPESFHTLAVEARRRFKAQIALGIRDNRTCGYDPLNVVLYGAIYVYCRRRIIRNGGLWRLPEMMQEAA